MVLKRMLSLLFVIVSLCCLPLGALADEDPPQDPAIVETLPTDDSEDSKFTAAQFDGLSDDQKRNIYYNSPELLPDNFNPADYWDIIHEGQNP